MSAYEDTRNFLNSPISIGGKTVPNRLFLSPMAGLGHVAYRDLLTSFGGCGLFFSEMCNAKKIPHENRHVSPTFRWRDDEASHLIFQIFGADPGIMAEAAKRIERENMFGVDINFGCSVAAICNKNAGAALLKQPDTAENIVRAVRAAVQIPVTVKYRTGWEDDPAKAVDLAKRFENAGADALSFHPRVAPDRRLRTPKWEYIGRVKDSVRIPVFGNGNVFTMDDCHKLLKLTGCDGVLLGRIAIAKPWIFREMTTGNPFPPDVYKQSISRYTYMLEKHYEPVTAVKFYKKAAVYFAANFKFGLKLWPQLCNGTTMDHMRANIDTVFATVKEVTERPNMNLFL